MQNGRIDLQPEYQRDFEWQQPACSKFIETVLLQVPFQEVWLHEQPDRTRNVVDGQQRLTTLRAFKDTRLPNGQVFKLQVTPQSSLQAGSCTVSQKMHVFVVQWDAQLASITLSDSQQPYCTPNPSCLYQSFCRSSKQQACLLSSAGVGAFGTAERHDLQRFTLRRTADFPGQFDLNAHCAVRC